MAELLYGAPVAAAINDRTADFVDTLKKQGTEPCLVTLRVGEQGGSLAYERNALKRCAGLGIKAESISLPETAGTAEVLAEIDRINRSEDIHGCLLFLPLPRHIDQLAVRLALRPEKDIDCVTPASLGAVFSGMGPGFAPCTAQGCVELLDHYAVELKGVRAAVIGRSLTVGRPLSMLLQARDATVTLCHSGTRNLSALCREQDIVVAAAGRAGLVDASFLRPGQTVIDVGTNVGPDGKLTGDVRFDEAEPVVRALTPVPGGVGAVTTAVLANHVARAAAQQRGVHIEG